MQGRLTVQCFRRDEVTLQSKEVGEPETEVLAVDVSIGDNLVSVTWDEERSSWEIEYSGRATIYTH